MKYKFLLLLLFIKIPLHSTCQVKITGDSLKLNYGKYILKKHPLEENKIICKFYNADNKLKTQTELLSMVNEVNDSNLLELLNNKKLVNDGNYFEFFDNGDTSLIARYDHGYKIDKEFKLFENGIIKEIWEYISPVKIHITAYYPDGTRLIEFTVVNNKKEGTETHYFENGKVKLRMTYKDNGFKLIEYSNTGDLIREQDYGSDRLVPSSCNAGANSHSDLIEPLSFPGDLNEEMNKLYANESINKYLLDNNLQFSFNVLVDGSLADLKFEGSPDMVNYIVYKWFTNMPKWKYEIFSNVKVKCKVLFNLSGINGPFSLERLDYDAQMNNHPYNPVYMVKPCIYIALEQMPVFQGGENKLPSYLKKHLNYPSEAAKKGVEGVVYTQFIITKEGNVKNVKVLRGIDPDLDAEAIRVITSMPTWTPGRQGGIALPVQMTLPINFKMEK